MLIRLPRHCGACLQSLLIYLLRMKDGRLTAIYTNHTYIIWCDIEKFMSYLTKIIIMTRVPGIDHQNSNKYMTLIDKNYVDDYHTIMIFIYLIQITIKVLSTLLWQGNTQTVSITFIYVIFIGVCISKRDENRMFVKPVIFCTARNGAINYPSLSSKSSSGIFKRDQTSYTLNSV